MDAAVVVWTHRQIELAEDKMASAWACVNLSPFDAVTTGAGSVWVTDQAHGAVRRIDPATHQIQTIAEVPP